MSTRKKEMMTDKSGTRVQIGDSTFRLMNQEDLDALLKHHQCWGISEEGNAEVFRRFTYIDPSKKHVFVTFEETKV